MANFLNSFNSIGSKIKIIHQGQMFSGKCLEFNVEFLNPEFEYLNFASSQERIISDRQVYNLYIRISDLTSEIYNDEPETKNLLEKQKFKSLKLDENLYYENLTQIEHLKNENKYLEQENKDQRFLIKQMNIDLKEKDNKIKSLEEKLKKYGLLELKPGSKNNKSKYDRFKLLEKEE